MGMDGRVWEHPVLGAMEGREAVVFTVDGREVAAVPGDSVLSALLANGVRVNRYTDKRGEPRGLFCGIGQCTDCAMVVDGVPNTRTCITPARAGMDVRTQRGLGGGARAGARAGGGARAAEGGGRDA
jgi:predicted molibdopterin-dependent oxidoreductase YjgC